MDFQHRLWTDVETTNIKSIIFNIGYENWCWNPLYNIDFSQNRCGIIKNIQKMQKQHWFCQNQCRIAPYNIGVVSMIQHWFLQNRCYTVHYNIDFSKTDVVMHHTRSILVKIDVVSYLQNRFWQSQCFFATMQHRFWLKMMLYGALQYRF